MTDIQEFFGPKDVDRATEGYVNSGVLRSWIVNRIMPSNVVGGGRGRQRQYSRADIYLLAIMSEFRRWGVRLKVAQDWTTRFYEKIHRREVPSFIAWHQNGRDFVVADPNMTIFELYKQFDKPNGFCVVIPGEVIRRVNERLEAREVE